MITLLTLISLQLPAVHAQSMNSFDEGGGGGGATVGGGSDVCSITSLEQIYRDYPGIAHANERREMIRCLLEMCPNLRSSTSVFY